MSKLTSSPPASGELTDRRALVLCLLTMDAIALDKNVTVKMPECIKFDEHK